MKKKAAEITLRPFERSDFKRLRLYQAFVLSLEAPRLQESARRRPCSPAPPSPPLIANAAWGALLTL